MQSVNFWTEEVNIFLVIYTLKQNFVDYIRQNTSLIENAERNGHLKEGTTLIVVACPTQAVGLAVVATVKGHKCVLVIEGEAGQEIKVVLERLGVDVVEASKVSGCNVEEAIKNVKNLIVGLKMTKLCIGAKPNAKFLGIE